MSVFRLYIKPFDEFGNYLDDFIEVTNDLNISGLGSVNQMLDNDEYNVGVFRYNNLPVTLRNDHGRYSDTGVYQSIFRYKKKNSIIRLTYDYNSIPSILGQAVAGQSFLSEETPVYEGLLDDTGSQSNIDNQVFKFNIIGKESIFDQVEAPTITIGDTIRDAIFNCLNQPEITAVLEVDTLNIAVGIDTTLDDVSDFENVTVKEAIDILLEISNTVLFVKDNEVFTQNRVESATTKYTFYGQASVNGLENIQDIKNIKSGNNKLFNYVTWSETSLVAKQISSISINGIRKKEIDHASLTDTTKRQNLLDNIKDEFGANKKELTLSTPLNMDRLNLFLLDKISIDYPTVLSSASGGVLPIYGVSVYGQASYPVGQWALTIDPSEEWKIIGRKIDVNKHLLHLTLKEV